MPAWASPVMSFAPSAVEFDAKRINKLGQCGKRRPLARYLPIPFCDTMCHYCACNKIVTQDRSKAATCLRYLKREIDIQGKLFAGLQPDSPLRLVGPDIDVREGCYNGHSQMIRPFRAETERYGHYSMAGA